LHEFNRRALIGLGEWFGLGDGVPCTGHCRSLELPYRWQMLMSVRRVFPKNQ
jgi:hypothetical protein